ncbi:MAG TPA: glycosyltransferase [Candidatus Paceibacterota bacterium]
MKKLLIIPEWRRSGVGTIDPNRLALDLSVSCSVVVASFDHWLPQPLRNMVVFLKILKLARQADVVMALSPVGTGSLAAKAAQRANKRFVVWVEDDYAWREAIRRGDNYLLVGDFQKSKKEGTTSSINKKQIKSCEISGSVLVPSSFMSRIVLGWGIDPTKIKILIYPTDFYIAGMTKEECRKKIGIPGALIVSKGPLVPWMGFRMLVKIMPQLLEINQFFRLVIMGSGPEQKVLESMIKNIGLNGKVIFVGEIKEEEELSRFFLAADLLILNSGHEPSSSTVLRAMSAGVPVVATAVGANPELIRQGENGFIVRYNDEFNILEAVKALWRNAVLRDQFVEAGLETSARLREAAKDIAKII